MEFLRWSLMKLQLFFFGLSNAPGVVIERANNIIDRSEALLHPEACRKGNA